MSWWSFLKVSPILIPFVIGIYKYKEIRNLRYLFFFVCYGVLNETVTKILRFFDVRNNLYLAHLYAFVSFILLCLFFQQVFLGFIKRIWFRSLIAFFSLLCIVQLVFFQSITDYPSLQLAILALVMVVFSIIYFYKVMLEAKMLKLNKDPLIWITTSMLVYYTGNLFYYILFNLFIDYSIEYLKTISIYFISLNTLFYVLISIGFMKASINKRID